MIQNFKKKPVVIQAIQLTPETFIECHKFLGLKGAYESGICVEDPGDVNSSLNSGDQLYIEIKTLEGLMKVQKGDWIIKGVNGEFYPCKPDIFGQTYELLAIEADSEDMGSGSKEYMGARDF